MAQLTDAVFSINGTPISTYSSFTLTQSIFEHHRFTLTCTSQTIDGLSGIFSSSQDMIGNTFEAHISGIGLSGELQFNGIITNVETSRVNGEYGNVIISGYSPTIILDNGPHCKSWENQTVKGIAEDVLKHFPHQLLAPKFMPVSKQVFEYAVQYKETAWAFLHRLCAQQGEWLYWNGSGLVMAPPSGDTKTQLVYGSTLSHFNIHLNARPTDRQYIGWDYQNSLIYTSAGKEVGQKAGLNALGTKVLENAQTIFGTQPKQWNFRYADSKKQQDDMATLHGAIESSKMIMLTGQSGHPGVAIGSRTEITGNNVFNGGSTEDYGEYLVIAVEHFVDTKGDYSNHFTAVPGSLRVPPVVIPEDPLCEVQSAFVTDNADPRGMGRVRVKFHWMNGPEKTPWIRIAAPHGGHNKGHFFIPENGEEVMIGFEGKNAHRPYVIGAVYHADANTEFGNADNDIKTIQTRSGNKIVYDDGGKSITLQDASGNTVLMDGNGSIVVNAASSNVNIRAPQTMNLNASDLNLVANNTLSILVGNTFNMSAGNQIMMNVMAKMLVTTPELRQLVTKYMHLQAGKALINTPEGEMKIEAEDFYLAGQKKIFLHSNESATINSKGIAEIKVQEANKHSNTAVTYEVAPNLLTATAIVHFRPQRRWKGQFGFDWFRIGDTRLDGDVSYDSLIGQYYTLPVTDANTKRNADVNSWTANFHADPQPAAFTAYDRLTRLKGLYGNYTYSFDKDAQGKPINIPYYIPFLALLPRKTDPANPNTVLESGEADLELHLTIKKVDKTEQKPDKLIFEMDNTLMDEKHPLVSIDKHTILKEKISSKIDVTITCKADFNDDKEIKVWAISLDPQSKQEIARFPAGILKIVAPLKKMVKDIVIVKVRTNAGTGSPSSLNEIKRNLKQALIGINLIEKAMNPDSKRNDFVSLDVRDHTKNHQTIDFNAEYNVEGTNIKSSSGSKNVSLDSFLKTELEKRYPGTFTNHFKLFFLANTYQQVLADDGTGTGVGGYSNLGTDYGLMFKTHSATTIGHECLHGLGLPHTFYGEEYIYKAMSTDNVMDYSHLTKDKVTGAAHTAIDRVSTWYWQWKIINSKI
ncbi:type VI secretion system Vgr family protein [Chitinophaga sp. 22536]|uniref:type VI secretion system Vgr family protein n=1 Tax=unclassified Chitinophaga TaxID=2619133 RepID=UPI003F849CE0